MIEVNELLKSFQQNKHLVLKTFVNPPLLMVAYKYAMMKAISGQMQLGDSQIPNTPNAYADPFMETLLEKVRPRLEMAIGLKLFPTYSYFRVYQKGDLLKKHKDRPSCEISVTLTLGSDGSAEWPIYVEKSKGFSAIKLNAGDALVYRGYEVAHWREPYEGEHQVQVFLHYVDQNGPFTEWRFDKRPHLGGCVAKN
jgi:hypothetical protein